MTNIHAEDNATQWRARGSVNFVEPCDELVELCGYLALNGMIPMSVKHDRLVAIRLPFHVAPTQKRTRGQAVLMPLQHDSCRQRNNRTWTTVVTFHFASTTLIPGSMFISSGSQSAPGGTLPELPSETLYIVQEFQKCMLLLISLTAFSLTRHIIHFLSCHTDPSPTTKH